MACTRLIKASMSKPAGASFFDCFNVQYDSSRSRVNHLPVSLIRRRPQRDTNSVWGFCATDLATLTAPHDTRVQCQIGGLLLYIPDQATANFREFGVRCPYRLAARQLLSETFKIFLGQVRRSGECLWYSALRLLTCIFSN